MEKMGWNVGKIFSKKIRLTLAELYFLIQIDREVWEYCESMEKALLEFQSLPAETLRARLTVLIELAFGSTRAELIEKISGNDASYKRSYAEKFVDETIKRLKGLLKDNPALHIVAGPEPVKGQFGKPYSRAYGRLGKPDRGRPAIKYELKKHPMVKLNKRMEKLVILTTLLSGSSLRYQELRIKIIEMMKSPEVRKILLEVSERVYSIPPDDIKKFEILIIEKGEDLIKQAEEELRNLNDLRNKLIDSMQKEVPKIFGLKLPSRREGRVPEDLLKC
jgi:hypothetical protein